MAAIVRTVHRPVLAELARRGMPFRGALFAGLMLTADGPRLLEFNVRFGDPETQAILPRLTSPLAPLLLAASERSPGRRRRGHGHRLTAAAATAEAAAAVVLAAPGYPEAPAPATAIEGIDAAGSRRRAGLLRRRGRGRAGGLVTAGGRVLAVVGQGADVGRPQRIGLRGRGADRLRGRAAPPRHRRLPIAPERSIRRRSARPS